MFYLVYTSKFKKDIRLLKKRGHEFSLFRETILILEEDGNLPTAYSPHKLSGNYSGFWEAHIKPDWLIIWKVLKDKNEIWLTRTGSHSDLF